ncbi:MAG: hypothetical protein A4E44_01627 [Methanosaeta sp. PtaB.Bin018]|jgi:hypothetical protein|nr:DUF3795 domain-containing protein [Methanothrix sp.]OPX75047.1 MAG: hypothetical protein A4E44_01627 [Methanosaeta sp. PtaB.Bin018]OPY43749.1 MAG: hypothetical protein A4E46_01679 [Methanosaeta sp. PtaU1.Bin016]
MDLKELTAPCGLDCFNCPFYLANDDEEIRRQVALRVQEFGLPLSYEKIYEKVACKGCRKRGGVPPFGTEPCKVFRCISSKGIESCADCSDFPCDNLHPYAEHASVLPHNIKVFNLALIRKIGVERWAKEKAKSVRETYFGAKWNI